jgi:hypothetical protein
MLKQKMISFELLTVGGCSFISLKTGSVGGEAGSFSTQASVQMQQKTTALDTTYLSRPQKT